MSDKMIVCKVCGSDMAKSAKACPHCGAKNKKPFYKKWWFWLIVAFFVIGVIGSAGSDDVSATDNSLPANTEVVTENSTPVVDQTKDDAPKLTTGQKNALRSADTYLSVAAFSYDGLIQQLEFEGYSTEEATYAADNCGADWNEQAAKSAKAYLRVSSFSRNGLIDQLIFEGFTREQAEYGVSQNGY